MEKFNFSQPQDWPKWIRRFEHFRQASGIASKSEESQVNTLVYSMGDKADDILQSFNLTEADQKKYSTVKDKFERYFVKRGTLYLSVQNSTNVNKRKTNRWMNLLPMSTA